jgi:pseudo-rSAM protein
MMKKYWLTFYANTFLWHTPENVLVYNSENRQMYLAESNYAIKKHIDILISLDNLYTTEIQEKELENVSLRNWIEGITTINAGKFVEQIEGTPQPVSFFPFLKIQNRINRIQWEHSIGISESLLYNLQEITVHINGSEKGNELFAKQTYYPLTSLKSIPFDDLKNFIQKCMGRVLNRINLIGNIFDYPNLDELCSWIASCHLAINTYVHSSDFINNKKIADLKSINKFNIIHDQLTPLSIILDKCKYLQIEPNFVFPLTSEKEYEKIIVEIEKFYINNYNLIPVFDDQNIHFFEKHIFTTHDDFLSLNLSKRNVFAHQTINTNFFGKLIILPDGSVYANLNQPLIGTIYDSPYNILYKEMVEGLSWRMIREQSPCSACIYQWLCPSPSNYELVIKRHNLCHITPN